MSSPSKVILVLGKVRNCRVPNLGCRGAESPGWFEVSPNCTRCDAWVGALSWWSCQSPVAHSCSLLNQLNSFCGGMFKLSTKFDADLLPYSVILFYFFFIFWSLLPPYCSVILNMTPHSTAQSFWIWHHTVHTCSLNGIYCPHWLQWSHRSCVCIPSPLSLATRLHWCFANRSHYLNNGWSFPRQTSLLYVRKL